MCDQTWLAKLSTYSDQLKLIVLTINCFTQHDRCWKHRQDCSAKKKCCCEVHSKFLTHYGQKSQRLFDFILGYIWCNLTDNHLYTVLLNSSSLVHSYALLMILPSRKKNKSVQNRNKRISSSSAFFLIFESPNWNACQTWDSPVVTQQIIFNSYMSW